MRPSVGVMPFANMFRRTHPPAFQFTLRITIHGVLSVISSYRGYDASIHALLHPRPDSAPTLYPRCAVGFLRRSGNADRSGPSRPAPSTTGHSFLETTVREGLSSSH